MLPFMPGNQVQEDLVPRPNPRRSTEDLQDFYKGKNNDQREICQDWIKSHLPFLTDPQTSPCLLPCAPARQELRGCSHLCWGVTSREPLSAVLNGVSRDRGAKCTQSVESWGSLPFSAAMLCFLLLTSCDYRVPSHRGNRQQQPTSQVAAPSWEHALHQPDVQRSYLPFRLLYLLSGSVI